MHIVLLDRNIISLMKDFMAEEDAEIEKFNSKCIRYPYVADKMVANNRSKNQEHANIIKSLLRRDVEWNFFSIITSVIESGYGRRYDVEEYKLSLKADGLIVRKFFHRARTDERILGEIHNQPENKSLIIEEKLVPVYEAYLREIAPYSRTNTESFTVKKDKILLAADNASIPRSHFIVVCCLSAASGCAISRAIIKKKKRRPGDNKPEYYNVLNDIMVASRIGQLLALDQSNTYEFLTLEKSLSTFIELCPVTASSHEILEHDVRTHIRISPQRELFPNLTEAEYEKLILEDFGGVRNQ